jgi:type VI secretion system protein ImpC
MPPKFAFEVPSKPSGTARRREAGPDPFRLLVVGSFGGADRRGPVPISVETFDDVLARAAVRLRLAGGPAGEAGTEISFSRIEDFHPDSLLGRVGLFATLPEAVLAAVRSPAASSTPSPAPEPAADGPHQKESDAATLGRLLGDRPARPAATARASGDRGPTAFDLIRLIGSLVAPHVVPAPGPREELERRLVGEARGAALRAILHHPEFQALEASWRSVHRLVTHLDTDAGVRIDLLDAGCDRVAGELRTAAANGTSWSLIVADFTFGPDQESLDNLEALGSLASGMPSTLLAGADPALLGCRSLVETPDPASWSALDSAAAARWRALRAGPAGRAIGLALPRVLLRRPYGRRSDPVEGLPFEEMGPTPEHARYLWGNASFAVAEAIARAFQDEEAPADPSDNLVLDDLPAAIEETGSAKRLKPCAETLLSEAEAEAILSRGLMPIVSHRNHGSARVARLQAVADPPTPLRGPWAGGSN